MDFFWSLQHVGKICWCLEKLLSFNNPTFTRHLLQQFLNCWFSLNPNTVIYLHLDYAEGPMCDFGWTIDLCNSEVGVESLNWMLSGEIWNKSWVELSGMKDGIRLHQKLNLGLKGRQNMEVWIGCRHLREIDIVQGKELWYLAVCQKASSFNIPWTLNLAFYDS